MVQHNRFASLSLFLISLFFLSTLIGIGSYQVRAQTSSACNFPQNLTLGTRSALVIPLQQFLNSNPTTQVAASGPGSPGQETAYFGPATRAALIRFQESNASQILDPYGLASGTGYFGTLTRTIATAQCLQEQNSPNPSSATSAPAPTQSSQIYSITPSTSSTGSTFSIADLESKTSYGADTGFKVAQVTVVNENTKTSATLTLSKTNEQLLSNDIISQTWSSRGGEASIQATLKKAGDDVQITATVTAGQGYIVKNVGLGAPWVLTTTSGPSLKAYSSFRGGEVHAWQQTCCGHDGESIWPGYAYSPLAVFYDSTTGEGVSFAAFDSQIHPTYVFWVTDAGRVDPEISWDMAISDGATAQTTLYLHHAFGMPDAGFSFYRQNVLIPFMQSKGISEATFPVHGVIAANGWPDNGDVAAAVRRNLGYGAVGYLQYAPPDGSQYYEPNPETLSWFPTLKAASQVPGNQVLGVLINPFSKSHSTSPTSDPNNSTWFPGGWGFNTLSLSDPAVQSFNNRLRSDLVSRGVNFAFWDSGGGLPAADVNDGAAWLDLFKSWKQAGITVAAESSSDISVYTAGTMMQVPYDNGQHRLAQVVTPRGSILMYGSPGYFTPYTPTATAPYWWDDATTRGYTPLLNDDLELRVDEIQTYAKEHNISPANQNPAQNQNPIQNPTQPVTVAQPLPVISIFSPVGGEAWLRSSAQTVSWTSINLSAGATVGIVARTNATGDANWDGVINDADVAVIRASWQTARGGVGYNSNADVNNDGFIDLSDLSIATNNAGKSSDYSLLTGDVNHDGVVNAADSNIVNAAWQSHRGDATYNAAADINGDGFVDIQDMSLVTNNNGRSFPNTGSASVSITNLPLGMWKIELLASNGTNTVSSWSGNPFTISDSLSLYRLSNFSQQMLAAIGAAWQAIVNLFSF